jgi:hypothetical protein
MQELEGCGVKGLVSKSRLNHTNANTNGSHDPPKYLTTRKSDVHEEPDWSASESRYACALAEEEGEEHQVVVVDPD